MATASVHSVGAMGEGSGDSLEARKRAAMRDWLGIKPAEEQPTYYRLLGLQEGEDDAMIISEAADRQMAHLRTKQNGPQASMAQALLNMVSNARVNLLDTNRKAQYDETLRSRRAPTQVDATRAQIASAVPQAAVAPPIAPPIALNVAPRAPRTAPQGTLIGKLQENWKAATATAVAGMALVAGTVWMAGAGNDKAKKESEPIAAKAPKEPGKDPKKSEVAVPAEDPNAQVEEKPFIDLTGVESRDPNQEPTPAPEESGDVRVVEDNGNERILKTEEEKAAFLEEQRLKKIREDAEKAEAEARAGQQQQKPEDTLVAVAPGVVPAPAERYPTLNHDRVKELRATIKLTVKDSKNDAEKINAVLDLANDPDMSKDPDALRAIYDEAFDLAVQSKDLKTLRKIQKIAASLAILYTSDELKQHLGKTLDAFEKATGGTEYKRNDKTRERQAHANEMLSIAEELSVLDPAATLKGLPSVRKAAGNQAKPWKDTFDGRVNALETSIKNGQELEKLNGVLAKSPDDTKARTSRGLLRLVLGDADGMLDDLAATDHRHGELSKDTKALLSESKPNAKRAVELAKKWQDIADGMSNGGKKTIQRVAVKLYTAAIGSDNEPLNPIEKKLHTKTRDDLAAESGFSVESLKWESVVESIKGNPNAMTGRWKIDDKTKDIVLPRGALSALVLPATVPGGDFDMQLEFDVSRTDGAGGAINLILPFGEKGVCMTLDAGGASGISNVDGKPAFDAPDAIKKYDIGVGRFLVKGRAKREGKTVTISFDLQGKNFSWTGDESRLSGHPGSEIPKGHFGVSGYETSLILHDLRIQLNKGTMEVNGVRKTAKGPKGAQNAAAPKIESELGKWVNTLEDVQAKQAAMGKWAMNKNVLGGTGDDTGKFVLPYRPTGDYDFEATIMRTDGAEDVNIFLPLGNAHRCMLLLGHKDRGSGIDQLRGSTFDKNETSRPNIIVNNKPFLVGGQVRFTPDKPDEVEIRIFVNNQEYINWKGPASDLSVKAGWELPENTLGFGLYRSSAVFSNVRVRPVTGTLIRTAEKVDVVQK